VDIHQSSSIYEDLNKKKETDIYLLLRGHVGEHYLSALPMNYASTKNAGCRRKMNDMMAELKA
jgi:hypothetical protein